MLSPLRQFASRIAIATSAHSTQNFTSFQVQNKIQNELFHRRAFHATRPHEIWPLIGLGVIVVSVGVSYAIRAKKRMELESGSTDGPQKQTSPKSNSDGTSNPQKNTPKRSSVLIGIDIGTSNCRISVQSGDHTPIVIQNHEGNRNTPAYLAYDENAQSSNFLVGQLAKVRRFSKSDKVVYGAQQFLGRSLKEPFLQELITETKVKAALIDTESGIGVNFGQRKLSPVDIYASYFNEMMAIAENQIDTRTCDVSITVPSSFTDQQKYLIYQAAQKANISSSIIVEEPIAAVYAAIERDLLQLHMFPQKILVVDIGGFGSNISLINCESDKDISCIDSIHLLQISGEKIDTAIVNFLAENFEAKNKIQLTNDPFALQRLHEAAEKSKFELSSNLSSEVNLPFITADMKGPKHLNQRIMRVELSKLIEDQVRILLKSCEELLQNTGIKKKNDLEYILVTGGVSRLPQFKEAIQEKFGLTPIEVDSPEELAVIGAPIAARQI